MAPSESQPEGQVPAGGEKPGFQIKKKAVLWGIVAAVCICGVFFIGWNMGAAHAEQQYNKELKEMAEQLAQEVAETPQPVEHPAETISPAETEHPPVPSEPVRGMPSKKENERAINFENLQSLNEDVIAWIEIPGTEVDHPVLTTEDNNYYLEQHDYLLQPSEYGAIYTDMANKADFSDPLTVVYGHNMKDGSMFGSLHRYEDELFFDENRLVRLYMPDGQYDYEIFAAYQAGDERILFGKDFYDPQVLEAYLEEVRSNDDPNAHIDMADVTADDIILTLSTCVRGADENRYVVQARLIQD